MVALLDCDRRNPRQRTTGAARRENSRISDHEHVWMAG
jgi:hypothetical protein